MEPLRTATAETRASIPAASNEPQPLSAAKEKHRRLFQRGLKCLGVGLFLMGVSFAVNLLLFHSEQDFTVTMYVLTSLGAAFIVFGLVCLFGF